MTAAILAVMLAVSDAPVQETLTPRDASTQQELVQADKRAMTQTLVSASVALTVGIVLGVVAMCITGNCETWRWGGGAPKPR